MKILYNRFLKHTSFLVNNWIMKMQRFHDRFPIPLVWIFYCHTVHRIFLEIILLKSLMDLIELSCSHTVVLGNYFPD